MFHLRDDLSQATQDPSFREMEKDPSEFLRALETPFPLCTYQNPPSGSTTETRSLECHQQHSSVSTHSSLLLCLL